MAIRPLVALVLGTTLGLSAPALWAGGTKTVCHIPPGNPEKQHAITVSESAVAAHLAHGDTVLPDGESCGEEAGVVAPTAGTVAAEICPAGGGEGIRIVISRMGSRHSTPIACAR